MQEQVQDQEHGPAPATAFPWGIVIAIVIPLVAAVLSGLVPSLLDRWSPPPPTERVTPHTPVPIVAEPSVQVIFIEYNPRLRDPDSDPRNEHVLIKNVAENPQDLTGWTLKDDKDHTYTFRDFTLDPGATVKVWTKDGQDTAIELYWGTSCVWNNDSEDCATLYDARGDEVSTYCYSP